MADAESLAADTIFAPGDGARPGGFCAAPAESELALMAEDLRLASRALSRITVQVVVDHLLYRIFSEFCIGK